MNIRKLDRTTILRALQAGIAPNRGLQHLQVGREHEVEAVTSDLLLAKSGSSAVRFIIGDYGAGKSFFLQLTRGAAHRAGLVTMSADITQDARLYGTGGKVRSLHSALVASMGSRTQPEGGALAEVLERFLASCRQQAQDAGQDLEAVVTRRLTSLHQFQSGFAFARVVMTYWHASQRSDDATREAVLRWFRAEYSSRTEARRAIGVDAFLGDGELLNSWRLFAQLVMLAGYGGLHIQVDEMAVLTRLNRATRNMNYEQILTMINSLLTGQAAGLSVIFAGTPDFVRSNTTGLYSYGALRQRLGENPYAEAGLRDASGIVIDLEPLDREDLFVLLLNVHSVYCSNGQRDPLRGEVEEVLHAFMQQASEQLGGITRVSPREATRTWLHLLNILDQNRKKEWRDLLKIVTVAPDEDARVDGYSLPQMETASAPEPLNPHAHSAHESSAELAGFRL
ncbi:BREX system ATP-binding domain-containing protein [Kineococcus sp. SYSU DK004]|uniref:BREX system ATP-binding domain-containing protein n=1 Tax=Kineococcus sp. SYSU DK004 TaxID=3383125 RepID=UPI003D7CCE5B